MKNYGYCNRREFWQGRVRHITKRTAELIVEEKELEARLAEIREEKEQLGRECDQLATRIC